MVLLIIGTSTVTLTLTELLKDVKKIVKTLALLVLFTGPFTLLKAMWLF